MVEKDNVNKKISKWKKATVKEFLGLTNGEVLEIDKMLAYEKNRFTEELRFTSDHIYLE